MEKTLRGREYQVRDMSLADSGRHKIALAEVGIPGLMALRAELGPSQPFKGAKITCSLPITTHHQPPDHYSADGALQALNKARNNHPSSSTTTKKANKKAKGLKIAAADAALNMYSKKVKKEKKILKKNKKELKESMEKNAAKEAEMNEMKSVVAQLWAECHFQQQIVNDMLPFFLN